MSKLINFNNKYIDKTFWVLFIALVVVAIIALFSASSTLVYEEHSAIGPIGQQIIFLLIGLVVAWFIQFIPSIYIRMGGYIVLLFSLLCMYIMLIPGNPFVVFHNEAGRWFNLFGFVFQPSELAKLSLVIVVADMLSRIHTEEDKKKYFWWTFGVTAVTVLPILTNNLSTAMLLSGIVFIMWFLARISYKYLGIVMGSAIAVLVLGYCIVEFAYVKPKREMHGPLERATTWVGRIDDMFAEHEDDAKFELNNDNYQRSIAKVAIARGGITPFGVGPGNSKERDFLPLAFADYIFAIIVEETGLMGAIGLIFLYMAILFRACLTSNRFNDYSSMIMVMGLALTITCQALISMAVAVGIGPVTGQPLPLISRGGTSVLITSIYFGVMMCVSREQKQLSEQQKSVLNESKDDVPDIVLE
ncbi:MAG: FtsW/RodA/SpoVE family cell cycle protein [Paludibacteraceae bacterium]|nr:FtsW/RodA/SpoVE family cell cycle protein [Paludibacteraceae bacterium]